MAVRVIRRRCGSGCGRVTDIFPPRAEDGAVSYTCYCTVHYADTVSPRISFPFGTIYSLARDEDELRTLSPLKFGRKDETDGQTAGS